MQFLELDCDPWREQIFVETQAEVNRMPVDDVDACGLYPEHRWVYDKLRLTRCQGIECGTDRTAPSRYPVFRKPIVSANDRGGAGCLLLNERDYSELCVAGDFWMRLLTGEQLSTDLAAVHGIVRWCRHTLGMLDGTGGFDHWVVEERPRPRLERLCREWIHTNLPGYTGMVNIETIGGAITSVHLRAVDQWPDLYGRKWSDALTRLYSRGTWDLVDNDRAEGYSAVLVGAQGARDRDPDPRSLAVLRATVGISTVRLVAMPSRGSYLAVINGFNLQTVLRVRATLAQDLGETGWVTPTRVGS